MNWMDFLRWFLMGIFGGLGWLLISTLWRAIFKNA